MMTRDDIAAPLDRARHYAALSSTFDPVEALAAAFAEQPYDASGAALVLADLRSDCVDAAGDTRWTMRQPRREQILKELDKSRPEPFPLKNLPQDSASRMIQRVYLGGPLEMDQLLTTHKGDIQALEEIANAIGQVGRAAEPSFRLFSTLRSTVDHLRAIERADRLLAEGFYGHQELRQRLADWIDTPPDSDTAQAIYIRGVPGVGKSYLLAKLVQEARARHNPVVLSLDFDRKGLNLLEPAALSMELSRQIADEIPEAAPKLADLRAKFSGERGRTIEFSAGAPTPLLEAMGEAIRGSKRTILLILDTLEVLRSYGRTHPVRLFEFLDQLIQAGMRPIAILAAGRGDAVSALGKRRLQEAIPLRGLPDAAARQLLAQLETPAPAIESILKHARGNPLLLRLSAKLVRQGATEIDWKDGHAPEIVGAYLYRAILSRIENKTLADIAQLGLIMPRISAQSISEIIAPALGISLSANEGEKLFAELRTHHWLVDDAEAGWVAHRSDIRSIILPMLQADMGPAVVAINQAAAAHASTDPALALYHRLQLVGPATALPGVASHLAAQFTEEMIEELPLASADAVRQARGERSQSGLEADGKALGAGAIPPPAPIDDVVLQDMQMLLERRDFAESELLYRRRFAHIDDPATPAATMMLSHFWMSGQWAKAKKMFDRLAGAGFDPKTFENAHPLYRQVALEMRAEFQFDRLVDEISADDSFCRQAQLSYRDNQRMRLTDGALAFALLAQRRDYTISGGWREAIGASATGLRDPSIHEYAMRDAVALREREGQGGDLARLPQHEVAAILNPYVQPISALMAIKPRSILSSYIHALTITCDQAKGLPLYPGTEVNICEMLLSSADQVVAHLAAAGGTADWLSAFAFFHSPHNVPLIARRAETWRRTAAGQWAYGDVPPDAWQDPETGVDEGAEGWFQLLQGADDPAEEAAWQLCYWAKPFKLDDPLPTSLPIAPRVRARLTSVARKAFLAARRSRGEPPTRAALRPIMSEQIGRSIAVPLAVLAANSNPAPGPFQSLLMRSVGETFEQILMGD